MPCRDNGGPYTDAYEYQKKIDELTRLLCALCERVENQQRMVNVRLVTFPEEVGTWWGEHKRKDAERKNRENHEQYLRTLRQQGLAKLTPAERAALGVKEP
jgi:hypothetical protein